MERIRICQLITELQLAGAERCVFELASRLDKNRFDVQVAALQGGVVADWLARAGVKVHVLGMRSKWDLPKLLALPDLLRRERIQILHTHLFHADLAGRWAADTLALPHLIHTVHVAEARFRPWQFAFARMSANRCDRIVAVSNAVQEHHARLTGLPAWRYQVIPNGIDASAYSADRQAGAELRQKLGIPAGEILLAYVGRLDRQKGIDVLLSAMSHLGARGKPVNLVIAGDGPRRFQVEGFMRHGEGGRHTRWLGAVQDVRPVLSAADIFVMPSRWEGLPLATAEAMAAGLPVLGTKASGLAELLDFGQAGMVINVDDVVALSDAIELLAGDAGLRQRLSQAGLQRVRQHYSIQANVKAHEELYTQIAARPVWKFPN
jgi:glycosyltransferase involved in cell wall biosynthesis